MKSVDFRIGLDEFVGNWFNANVSVIEEEVLKRRTNVMQMARNERIL